MPFSHFNAGTVGSSAFLHYCSRSETQQSLDSACAEQDRPTGCPIIPVPIALVVQEKKNTTSSGHDTKSHLRQR